MSRSVAADRWEGASPAEWHRLWRIPVLRIFAETGSTNDEARALALAGAPAGSVVIADHQWAGRGREGRTWDDATGRSLLLSLVLRPREPAAVAGPVPIRVGLAVCSAIERCAGLATRLKWPNDVLAPDGRKIAGILCEAVRAAEGAFVIAGIGLNVHQTEGEWPAHLAEATSILAAAGRSPGRAALATAIIDALRPFTTGGPRLDSQELLEAERRDALRGRPLTVDGLPAGTAHGILPDGALLVGAGSALRAIHSGTVRIDHRAAADASRDPDSLQQAGPP